MASQYDIHIRTDLDRPLMKYSFSGAMFSKDNKAHLIDVTTYKGNQTVAVTGDVEGVLRRNDGKVIGFEGSVSGGKAVIELPETAYEVDGPLTILVRNKNNGINTVIGYMSAYVNDSGNAEYGTGGTYVISIAEIQEKLDELDPLIARLQTLDVEDLADITTKLEELDALYEGITEALEFADLKVNKPTDDPNGTAGQMLRTKGDGTTEWADVGTPTDAQATSAINAWLNAHPEATTTVQDKSITKAKLDDNLQVKVDEVDYLKSAIAGITGNTPIPITAQNAYIKLENNKMDYENPTPSTNFDYYLVPCTAGDVFTVNAQGGNAPRAWGFIDSSKTALLYANASATAENLVLVAPTNAVYLIINDRKTGALSYYGNLVDNRISNIENNGYANKGRIANGTDLNTITTSGVYLLGANAEYVNAPSTSYGFLTVKTINAITCQTAETSSATYTRMFNGSSWTGWR